MDKETAIKIFDTLDLSSALSKAAVNKYNIDGKLIFKELHNDDIEALKTIGIDIYKLYVQGFVKKSTLGMDEYSYKLDIFAIATISGDVTPRSQGKGQVLYYKINLLKSVFFASVSSCLST